MRILLVEDEAPLRETLAARLKRDGFAVDAAQDGEEGIYLGREVPFDLAIIDLGLPKMSGMELIGRLQKVRRVLPTIMVTGMPPEEAWSRRTHLAAVLIKPYTAAELLAEVRKVLRPNDRADGAAVSVPIGSASR